MSVKRGLEAATYNRSKQIGKMAREADILVATPSRLASLSRAADRGEAGIVSRSLQRCDYLRPQSA